MDIGVGGGEADPMELAGEMGGEVSIMAPIIPPIIGSILIDPKGCMPAAAAAAAATARSAGEGPRCDCESKRECVRMCRVIMSRRQAA